MPTVFAGSLIDTPNGRKLAKHLREGDLVYSRDGTRTHIVSVEQVKEPCPIILKSRQYGSKVAVSPRTYITIKRGSQNIKRSASKLKRNDVIVHAGPIELSAKKLPIDPFALGFFLKSGDIAHSYANDVPLRIDRSYLKGSDLTPDTVQELARALGAVVVLVKNQKSKQVARYSFVKSDGHRVKWSDLKQHFPEELLADRSAIRIPSIYMRASVEQRTRLLSGILSGMSRTKGAESKTVTFIRFARNHSLAMQVMQLARSLGIPATLDGGNGRVRMQLTKRLQQRLLGDCLSELHTHCLDSFEERGFLLGAPKIYPEPLDMIKIQTKSKTLLAENYFPL